MWNCGLWEAVAKWQYREITRVLLSWGDEGWGLGRPRWPAFAGPSTRQEYVAHLAPKMQGGIRVFGYKLCTCGLEKDRPENSRQDDSWHVHRASSHFYQLEWRNLKPHRALDWVLSHLSKHRADLQVTAHQNKIQYSLKEFNKIQHSTT